MEEHPSVAQVVQLILARGVLALHSAGLHAVELDGRTGEVHARDARPEAAEDDGFDEVRVRRVRVEFGRRRLGGGRDEAKLGERGEEVDPERGDVAYCGRGDKVLRYMICQTDS